MEKLLLCIVTLLLTASAWARLGESTEECEKRYGAPLYNFTDKDSFLHNYYLKGEFFVQITFKDSKAVGISYGKPDQRNRFFQQLAKSKEWKEVGAYHRFINLRMLDYETELLRKYNAEGGTWNEILPGSVWRRSDGAEALYNTTDNTLSINRPEYNKHIETQAEKGLMGF